ncbi:MAG: molybdopterin-dependent oxidoreductase [Pseudomonadota bacterium]|nr:molybdopterin-dependent oxidoreductase [Pseudomonadota bacterium]
MRTPPTASRLDLSRSDRADLLAEARRLLPSPLRRHLLGSSLSLGGLAMLTGCSLSGGASAETLLRAVSRLNDDAQAWLFDPSRLAPVYREADVARPFPYNAYYGVEQIRRVDDRNWRLELGGLIAHKASWTLAGLAALPQDEQITRHICVEGWSAIGRWGGVRFSDFLKRVGADLGARYVGFRCFDDYYTSIDMATALHPQTLLALSFDGQPLPAEFGHPVKLRMPTKLGYKNPKYLAEIFVSNVYPGGYWEDQGYNWFGGS